MSDNIIKFRKPKPVKTPRPGQRKLLIILGVVAVFLATWAYFAIVGQPTP